jgi:hypothetical protein
MIMTIFAKPIYLKVAHVEDEDADYFVFKDLAQAISYVCAEELDEWVMSPIRFEEVPPDDYTAIAIL